MLDYKTNTPKNNTAEVNRNSQSLSNRIIKILAGSAVLAGLFGGSVMLSTKKADMEHKKFLESLENAEKKEYTIKKGDTLMDIAGVEGLAYDGRAFDFVDYVNRLNNLDSVKKLIPGQRISVPDLNGDGYVGTKYSHNLEKIK
ncbi:LysM peptidoglycan-binding domain-containing protein [Candidatus Woesearchaeota archaeon]|nr:LysM peptidoglycan-binding domain-containing protein [Candidatus Woesearchaeota archaeon]